MSSKRPGEMGRAAFTLSEGKRACTVFRSITFGFIETDQEVTLAEVLPVTNIPDQMEIHARVIGYPILTYPTGDLLLRKWLHNGSVVESDMFTSLIDRGKHQPLTFKDSQLYFHETSSTSSDIFPNDLPLSAVRS